MVSKRTKRGQQRQQEGRSTHEVKKDQHEANMKLNRRQNGEREVNEGHHSSKRGQQRQQEGRATLVVRKGYYKANLQIRRQRQQNGERKANKGQQKVKERSAEATRRKDNTRGQERPT